MSTYAQKVLNQGVTAAEADAIEEALGQFISNMGDFVHDLEVSYTFDEDEPTEEYTESKAQLEAAEAVMERINLAHANLAKYPLPKEYQS